MMDLLEVQCTGAAEQVERCRRAALTADTEVLGFEAHSMKGGAAAGAYNRSHFRST